MTARLRWAGCRSYFASRGYVALRGNIKSSVSAPVPGNLNFCPSLGCPARRSKTTCLLREPYENALCAPSISGSDFVRPSLWQKQTHWQWLTEFQKQISIRVLAGVYRWCRAMHSPKPNNRGRTTPAHSAAAFSQYRHCATLHVCLILIRFFDKKPLRCHPHPLPNNVAPNCMEPEHVANSWTTVFTSRKPGWLRLTRRDV
jgi:hypothetical protein